MEVLIERRVTEFGVKLFYREVAAVAEAEEGECRWPWKDRHLFRPKPYCDVRVTNICGQCHLSEAMYSEAFAGGATRHGLLSLGGTLNFGQRGRVITFKGTRSVAGLVGVLGMLGVDVGQSRLSTHMIVLSGCLGHLVEVCPGCFLERRFGGRVKLNNVCESVCLEEAVGRFRLSASVSRFGKLVVQAYLEDAPLTEALVEELVTAARDGLQERLVQALCC
jgi:hypothetical protein